MSRVSKSNWTWRYLVEAWEERLQKKIKGKQRIKGMETMDGIRLMSRQEIEVGIYLNSLFDSLETACNMHIKQCYFYFYEELNSF